MNMEHKPKYATIEEYLEKLLYPTLNFFEFRRAYTTQTPL